MLVDLAVATGFCIALALIAIAAASPPRTHFTTPTGKTRLGINRARVADTTGRTTNRRNP